MFGNIGWGEMMVLVVAALVILGPERLPGAVAWTTRSLRQVRNYASGATAQLKDELGPEFEELRKPLADLQQLRGMTPRSLITKHLLEGDDSFLKPDLGLNPPPLSLEKFAIPEAQPQLPAGKRPPIDTDAT